MWDLLGTLKEFEATFNSKFHYPYVIVNDEPFTQEFMNVVRRAAPYSAFSFGLIPVDHWSYPAWINTTRADELRQKMADDGVLYGGSLSYRHMCRSVHASARRPPARGPASQPPVGWRSARHGGRAARRRRQRRNAREPLLQVQ